MATHDDTTSAFNTAPFVLPTGPCLVFPLPDHPALFIKRFFAKVSKTERCWNWQGNLHKYGYGLIWKANKRLLAHRASWLLHYGDIPSDLFVLHHCDNPPCVRPDHLFLGTKMDNWRDSVSKRRSILPISPEKRLRGEDHGRAKLTTQQVKDILSKYQPYYYSRRKLAQEYGVNISVIGRIVRGESWLHITHGIKIRGWHK